MFSMLTLLYTLNTYLTLFKINKYDHSLFIYIIFSSLIFLRLVICHLWYRFSIDTEVLHSGIVPKPKLWYRAIPTRYIRERILSSVPSQITITYK